MKIVEGLLGIAAAERVVVGEPADMRRQRLELNSTLETVIGAGLVARRLAGVSEIEPVSRGERIELGRTLKRGQAVSRVGRFRGVEESQPQRVLSIGIVRVKCGRA